jgi:hypothetical protein
MIFTAGCSFGLFAGMLVCLFLHPVFRLRISPERRQKLLRSTLASLLGAGIAGALFSLLGRDAVVGYLCGLFPGFAVTFGYLEYRDWQRIKALGKMPAGKRDVAERALLGQLDPTDPTSARELEALLDQLGDGDPDAPKPKQNAEAGDGQ